MLLTEGLTNGTIAPRSSTRISQTGGYRPAAKFWFVVIIVRELFAICDSKEWSREIYMLDFVTGISMFLYWTDIPVTYGGCR